MTMRIGHTLFGGAVAGLVIASGVAVCAASASAHNQVTRHFESHAYAVSAVSGYGLRQANNYPSIAASTAHAYGAPIADYRPLPVEVTASAAATGWSTAQYFTYTFANAGASMEGAPIRRVKLFPRQAQAAAYAQGDSQTWQIGHAKKAYATAKGFGTTYFVGDGPAYAASIAHAQSAVEIGAHGHGAARAEASAKAVFILGFYGVGSTTSTAIGDAAVTVDGTLQLEANGAAYCSAVASVGTVGIQQSQTGRAFAHIVAYPKVRTGGKGRAKAFATGEGDALGMATGASAVEGQTSATATGDAHYQANAIGDARATAAAQGSAISAQTRAPARSAECVASALGEGLRTTCAGAEATGKAAARSVYQRKTVTSKPEKGSAKALALSGAIAIGVQASPAKSLALASGGPLRIQYARGLALAASSATGYNQVNDLQKAPERRTHKVAYSARVASIRESQRLIIV